MAVFVSTTFLPIIPLINIHVLLVLTQGGTQSKMTVTL